jgi:hypothetical protein
MPSRKRSILVSILLATPGAPAASGVCQIAASGVKLSAQRRMIPASAEFRLSNILFL